MASEEFEFLTQILNTDEYGKLSENVRKKIETYVKSKTEESVVAKALLETTKGNLGELFMS